MYTSLSCFTSSVLTVLELIYIFCVDGSSSPCLFSNFTAFGCGFADGGKDAEAVEEELESSSRIKIGLIEKESNLKTMLCSWPYVKTGSPGRAFPTLHEPWLY